MESFIVVAILGIVFFVGRMVWLNRAPKGRQHSDEELGNMSFDEWKALTIQTNKETGTAVLKVMLGQYEDLKKRISEKDPQTMELLDEQSIERSIASLELVRDELRRRNAL